MRPDLIRATIKTFQPDALIVDYLVLGMDDELCDVVFNMPSCEKYYILRGVLGRPVDVRTDVLTPMSLEALRNHFRRIIVMCDPKIIDTASEYNLDSTLSDKITYAGYAVGSPTKDQIENARRSRGVPDGKHWAVCSTGSGKAGENLAQRCWEISRLFPEVYFDIITGPRSTLQFNDNIHQSRRVILTPENPTSLPAMHAAADVVITRGGYNSLLEACIGTAQIIVAPIEGDYEQNEHAKRLGAYRDLSIIPSLEDLDLGLEEALSKGPAQPLKPSCISLCGAEAAARLITADLTACPSNDSVLQPTTEYAV